jgi:hypothetical protein
VTRSSWHSDLPFGLRHRTTGIAFEEWLKHPSGFPANDPISLMEIAAALTEGFTCDQRQWHQAMRRCIEALLRRGWRPMLPDQSGSWQWTNRFSYEPDVPDIPESISDAAVTSWVAFGDSGGAEDLRFATKLPDDPAGAGRISPRDEAVRDGGAAPRMIQR